MAVRQGGARPFGFLLNSSKKQKCFLEELSEQLEFLMNLSLKNNVSEGVRMLCNAYGGKQRAMRFYPDNLRYPEQVVVALEVAIAAIEKKDLEDV